MYMSIGLGTLKSFLGGVGGYTAGRLRASIADHIPTPKNNCYNRYKCYKCYKLCFPRYFQLSSPATLLYLSFGSSPKIHQAPMC